MKIRVQLPLIACALLLSGQAMAQITFYEGEGYRGKAFTTQKRIGDFSRAGYNDRASSVVVDSGRWEVCEDAGFQGRCVVLRRGSYDTLQRMGIDNRISSVRPVQGNRRDAAAMPEPLAAPDYAYRRRPNERVVEVPVTSVRAVVGPPSERCWVERQQVTEPVRNPPNVPGAILGTVTSRDVKRCATVASTTPAYWDVGYNYRGQERHVQMATPPGATIVINGNGQPRQ
jgi:hypothetical protein